MRKRPIIQMNAAFKQIKPAALSRHILALTAQLETLSLAKKPAPARPVNSAWNSGFPKVFRRNNEDSHPEVFK